MPLSLPAHGPPDSHSSPADQRSHGRRPGWYPRRASCTAMSHPTVSSTNCCRRPAGYYGIAPDLRGYGASETLPVDATRGVRDWSDDLRALFEAMGAGGRPIHLLAGPWAVASSCSTRWITQAQRPRSRCRRRSRPVWLGTIDTAGTLAYADGAGSGMAAYNPEFAARRSRRWLRSMPTVRAVMKHLYFCRLPRQRRWSRIAWSKPW